MITVMIRVRITVRIRVRCKRVSLEYTTGMGLIFRQSPLPSADFLCFACFGLNTAERQRSEEQGIETKLTALNQAYLIQINLPACMSLIITAWL